MVENDLMLVLGLLFVALIFPTTISTFSYGNSPSLPIICAVIGFGLVGYAVWSRPGGYAVDEVPQVVVKIIVGLVT